MLNKRLIVFVLAAVAVLSMLVIPLGGVSAGGGYMAFKSASSTCQQGFFTFRTMPSIRGPQGGGGAIDTKVNALDSHGTLLGAAFFSSLAGPIQNGSISYSQQPVGKVTFELRWLGLATGEDRTAQGGGGLLLDTITVPVLCRAGCDALIAIPSTAVMGKFLTDAPLYSAPGQLISPAMTITAGKTYLVIGMDATQRYYEILLQCQFVWVPANTVGPDPEPLWGGRSLPGSVIP